MRTLPLFTEVAFMAGLLVIMTWGTGFAAGPPPPPPPPPSVPAGDVFTQFAAGGGIAAYGAYRLWKAKRASKGSEKE